MAGKGLGRGLGLLLGILDDDREVSHPIVRDTSSVEEKVETESEEKNDIQEL